MTAAVLARACSSSQCLARICHRHCRQYAGNIKRVECAFGTRSAESNRGRLRIQLSRDLTRRLWKALGEKEQATLDRIPMNPDMFPLELFEKGSSLRNSLQGRIPLDPDKFPLEIFESAGLPELGDGVKKTLEATGDSPTEKRITLEGEIIRCLKRARREAQPQFFVGKAQDILELWIKEAQNNPSYPTPSWQAHEWILRGWKRIGLEIHERIPAERAHEVLRLLLRLVDDNAVPVQGQLCILFTWVIRLWLRAPHSLQRDPKTPKEHLIVAQSFLETATHAFDLILELERRSDEMNDEELCKAPDSATYSAPMNAFKKASMASMIGFPKQRSDVKDIFDDAVGIAETAARKSEVLLNRMEKRASMPGSSLSLPDVYSYRAVLSTWANANSREGAARAHGILRRMEIAAHSQGFRDLISYKRVLHAYARIAHMEEYDAEDLESPANRALSLLACMDPALLGNGSALPFTGQSSGVSCSVSPDVSCYGAVIQALAQADLGKQSTVVKVTPAMLGEAVLDRMEEAYKTGQLDHAPNSHCYGNVLRAASLWAGRSANKDNVASNIIHLLKRLEGHILQGEQISASTIEVTRWYNQGIKIVGHDHFGGSPKTADEILEQMEKLYLSTDWSTKRTIIQPDEGCYHSVLSAYEGSSRIADGSRAVRAINVLYRMIKSYKRERENSTLNGCTGLRPLRPGAFNSFLRTCASAEEAHRPEALFLARQVFDEMRSSSYASLNSISYGLMIDVYMKLLPASDERNKGICQIFQLCCDDGNLDMFVLQVTRKACDPEVFGSLLGSEAARHLKLGAFDFITGPAALREKEAKASKTALGEKEAQLFLKAEEVESSRPVHKKASREKEDIALKMALGEK